MNYPRTGQYTYYPMLSPYAFDDEDDDEDEHAPGVMRQYSRSLAGSSSPTHPRGDHVGGSGSSQAGRGVDPERMFPVLDLERLALTEREQQARSRQQAPPGVNATGTSGSVGAGNVSGEEWQLSEEQMKRSSSVYDEEEDHVSKEECGGK